MHQPRLGLSGWWYHHHRRSRRKGGDEAIVVEMAAAVLVVEDWIPEWMNEWETEKLYRNLKIKSENITIYMTHNMKWWII